MSMSMKVMLVDDHKLFIEGLQYLLEIHGIQVIGKARDGNEALIKARILRPDAILMDIRMPNCDGIQALRQIKTEFPDIKIVMLTTSEEEEDIFQAIKYGASGYLLKDTDASSLIQLLNDLKQGCMPLTAGLATRIMTEFCIDGSDDYKELKHKTEEKENAELTGRQLEVLKLVTIGYTYKEVGAKLGLTERTVKYHMGRIIEQLQLKNRSQVIHFATRTGLVQDK